MDANVASLSATESGLRDRKSQNDFLFDQIAEDAAATEFQQVFHTLLGYGGGITEETSPMVDNLIDTLNECVTKVSTLTEIVSSVFEAAESPVTHYTAAELLARICAKYTRKIDSERSSFASVMKEFLHKNFVSVQTVIKEFQSDTPPEKFKAARTMCLFLANLTQKLMEVPAMEQTIPAQIYSSLLTINILFITGGIRSEYFDNCLCGIQMLKILGPSIDAAVRNNPAVTAELLKRSTADRRQCCKALENGANEFLSSLISKFPQNLNRTYQSLRDMIISGEDLSPNVRGGILKILESRASRWGEVPTPDKPLFTDYGGHDVVDPVFYGPDNTQLTKEELEFLNREADASGDLAEEIILVEEEDDDELDNSGEYDYGDGCEPEVDFDQSVSSSVEPEPVHFVYGEDTVPDVVMQEYRRRLKAAEAIGTGDSKRES